MGMQAGKRLGLCLVSGAFLLLFSSQAEPLLDLKEEAEQEVPQEVSVERVAEDVKIAERLTSILEATGWFYGVAAEVREGVAFLRGRTDSEEHRKWAGQLAGKTEDVVAVVNRIQVQKPPPWDLSPAWRELGELGNELLRTSPYLLVGLILLAVTWFATKGALHVAETLFKKRLKSALLCAVLARAIAVPVFLLGLYLVLRVSGLTQLALTIIGSTGLLGLIIGFAFRDIAENFLASILVSIQQPFAQADLIEVAGFTGYVQSVNSRSTLLMTQEGNHVQIPNATIYKEAIINHSSNPNTRFEFTVGIGYSDSVAEAQSIALKVLQSHPAVLKDPEPLILVDELGAATVNLKVLFWIDISKYSYLKVRSAMIRLVKSAFLREGISMPDEAREVVFPEGVPVQLLKEADAKAVEVHERKPAEKEEQEAHLAEGGLVSDAEEIKQQASNAREPEGGANLLEDKP